MNKRLDQKLAAILADPHGCKEFILADAKDADMALGLTAPGLQHNTSLPRESRHKSLEDYRRQIRAVIHQDIVDIVLLSASNLEQLAMQEKLFVHSAITPSARANDTSDIWLVRGGSYSRLPSRPFRSAGIDHIKYGRTAANHRARPIGADLGLYSITFTNDLNADYNSLLDFREFRAEAERKRFRYFLEIFNPGEAAGIPAESVGAFVNDHIIRTLAGVTSSGRPLFLKIPYNGPRALEELVAYDPQLVIGILGGSAGTTRDAFQLIHDAKKHGARVALYGRKINLAEHPLAMIAFLRRVLDGEISPTEAVKAYHNELKKEGIQPKRTLVDDLQLGSNLKSYG